MPRVSSTITRQQTENAAMPRLPADLRTMPEADFEAFIAKQRSDRIASTEKTRNARAKSKLNKAENAAAKAVTDAHDNKVAAAVASVPDAFSFDDPEPSTIEPPTGADADPDAATPSSPDGDTEKNDG